MLLLAVNLSAFDYSGSDEGGSEGGSYSRPVKLRVGDESMGSRVPPERWACSDKHRHDDDKMG